MFTLRQIGFYLNLLWHQWEHGSIPDEQECLFFPFAGKDLYDEHLQMIESTATGETRAIKELKTVHLTCFQKHPTLKNRFINPRLEDIRKEQELKSKSYQERAKKGGHAKALLQAELKQNSSNADDLLNPAIQNQKHISSPNLQKDSSKRPARSTRQSSRLVSDDDWLKELKASPIYRGLDLDLEYRKCAVWCDGHGKKFTRGRFTNWLVKAMKDDKTVQISMLKPKAPTVAL